MKAQIRHRLRILFVILCVAGSFTGLLVANNVQSMLTNMSAPANAIAVGGQASGIASVVTQMNATRSTDHVGALVVSDALSAIAQAHAADMLARSYLGHNDPSGMDPFQRMSAAHYTYNYAAENIAMDDSLASANHDLYGSPEHLANIVDGHYTRVGVGFVRGNDGELLVEDFSD
jgi:uncharacterized protein YkwD